MTPPNRRPAPSTSPPKPPPPATCGSEKFGPTGTAEDFSRADEPNPPSYLSANRITLGSSLNSGAPAIAVGPHGEIYLAGGAIPSDAVQEYAPSGVLIRTFSGAETPGIGLSHNHGGFGGEISAVAVDPTSGDVLVSAHAEGHSNEGAIDEFDSSGHFLGQITETSPGQRLHNPEALALDSHGQLYVLDDTYGSGTAIIVLAAGVYLPDVSLAEATQRTPSAATLNGTVNPQSNLDPEEPPLTECRFEYVTEAAFKATGFSDLSSGGEAGCTPSAATIGIGEETVPVHASIGGLSPGTTYRYRLAAAIGGAKGGLNHTPSAAFTAPAPPSVEATFADNISSSFADLHATVDPLGAPTSYRFQYAPESDFQGESCEWVCSNVIQTPAGQLGEGGPTGSAPEAVLAHLGGLSPATSYRFRLLAESECEALEHPGHLCLTEGEAESFATLAPPATGLPDNRAYELLTPPVKPGDSDMFAFPETNLEYFNIDVGVPAESGDAFLLQTPAAFGPFPFAGQSAYAFHRDPARGEWTYTSLADPALGPQSYLGGVFDPATLSRVAFTNGVGSVASQAGSTLTSLLGEPGGPYSTLHADSPIHGFGAEADAGTHVVGASHDLSHVVLESQHHELCPGAEAQVATSHVLCEAVGGELKLLNANDEGKLLNTCGAVLGGYGGTEAHGSAHNAVSADGSRVFFTSPDPTIGNCGAGDPQLYLRSGGETVEVSAPEEGAESPAAARKYPTAYVGAAADGSRVFFLSEAWLTQNHPEAHDPELYSYDAETATLNRISAGEAGAPAATAGAQLHSVPAVSAQGNAVYFTAFGALAGAAKALPPTNVGRIEEAPVNLYRYDAETATTAFVATVDTVDYFGNTSCHTTLGDKEVALCVNASWYTTPDGRYLAFSSQRELTGYDTKGPCPQHNAGGGNGYCQEIYRYHYEPSTPSQGSILCASCDPSGAPPVSNAEFARSDPNEDSSGPVSAVSDVGTYVFFDTADPLVPSDTNHTLDVYEWEADGAGSCRAEAGCVSLISSGTDSAPSFLLGATPDGKNVFFGTHARLLPQDADTLGDIYDARVCEAQSPCLGVPASPTPQCEADSCSHPAEAPNEPTLATSVAKAHGNVHEEPAKPTCPKGRVRKAGKCVKKPKKHHKAKHKRAAKSNRRAGR